MDKNEVLLNLYERGNFIQAIEFIDENPEVDISVSEDYGLRNAIHLRKYDIVKELIKRGAKLSSVNHEAAYVFLQNDNSPEDMFRFVFSNIDPKHRTAPTIKDILFIRKINISRFEILLELRYIDETELSGLAAALEKNISNLGNSNELIEIFLKYNIKIPAPTREVIQKINSVKVFEFYHKNYKPFMIKCYEFDIPHLAICAHIAKNNIRDLISTNILLNELIRYCRDIELLEKYIVDNIDGLKADDNLIDIICGDGYDGLEEIEDLDIEKFKLLIDYDLIDINVKDNLFYHHAHITKSENAIKFIDSFYSLIKK